MTYFTTVTMPSDEVILAMTLARFHVALVTGRSFAITVAFYDIQSDEFKFRFPTFYLFLKIINTLARSFGSVAIETDSTQLASVAGRSRFTF